jgi:hypothetical protein
MILLLYRDSGNWDFKFLGGIEAAVTFLPLFPLVLVHLEFPAAPHRNHVHGRERWVVDGLQQVGQRGAVLRRQHVRRERVHVGKEREEYWGRVEEGVCS